MLQSVLRAPQRQASVTSVTLQITLLVDSFAHHPLLSFAEMQKQLHIRGKLKCWLVRWRPYAHQPEILAACQDSRLLLGFTQTRLR